MSRRSPAELLLTADASVRALPIRALPLLRARTLRFGGLLGLTTMLLVMFGSQPAMAAPGCGNIPLISGICSDITGTISFATDPTGYIAGQIKDALGSLLGQFAHLINATTSVDFSNQGFLETYAIGFAVASLFTVILWLVAVAKRAVAGVGLVEALGESIGYLVAAVAVTAFMPLAVALVVEAVDGATDAALSPMLGNIGEIGNTVTAAWGPVAGMSGGNVLMGIIGILMLVAAAGVWLELVIRAALIYLTLVFGPLVFAGLVDKSLWSHTKRWCGVMGGIILSKYVTLTTLALATGLLANDHSSDVDACLGIVLTALALFYLAMLAPVTLGRLIPVVGDDMATAHKARTDASGRISGLPSPMNSASEMAAARGGSSGDAATEAGDGQSGGEGTSADISGSSAQSANASAGSQGAEGGAGAAESSSAEALPAQGSEGVGASAAEAGATEETAVAAGGPVAAAALAAEKAKETGEQAVNAAVERSSGGEMQQSAASPGSSPGPEQQATGSGVAQQQQHLPAQEQQQPAQQIPPQQSAPPPSTSQGPSTPTPGTPA